MALNLVVSRLESGLSPGLELCHLPDVGAEQVPKPLYSHQRDSRGWMCIPEQSVWTWGRAYLSRTEMGVKGRFKGRTAFEVVLDTARVEVCLFPINYSFPPHTSRSVWTPKEWRNQL